MGRVCTKHKLEPRWATGIFCGVRLNTTEKIIATEKGIVVAQSVRRKLKELRWDADLFGKVNGTPWVPIPWRAARPEEAMELPESVEVEPELPEEPASEAVAADKKESIRRVYVRQTDLDTAACPACDLIRIGVSREGVLHSESCRSRLVSKMETSAEGRRRLEAAKRKELPSKARKVEEPEEPGGVSAASAPAPEALASPSAVAASAAKRERTRGTLTSRRRVQLSGRIPRSPRAILRMFQVHLPIGSGRAMRKRW